MLFGCPLFARFLIPSQAKPVAVKRHRKRVRLKTDAVANDSIGASVQETRANKVSACHAQLISDGGTIFAEWPENQQEAFFRAAGGANTDRNQMLLAETTLKMLQREHFRRAETATSEESESLNSPSNKS